MSEVKKAWKTAQPDFDGALLERPRAQLYARIDARVPEMVEAGMLDEVRALPASLSTTAEKAIGVREIRAHLAGEATLEETSGAIAQASRRYAKRQLTWFKRETGFQRVCLEPDETAESAVARVLARFPHIDHA